MAGTLGAVNSAHYDGNQVPTIMGVIGTLGTADTKGTALPLPIGVNPDNGALYVQDLSGAAGTTTVAGTVVAWDNIAKFAFDNITASYPDGTTETYVYKAGASTVGTVTVVYTDSTKGSISTVTRSL